MCNCGKNKVTSKVVAGTPFNMAISNVQWGYAIYQNELATEPHKLFSGADNKSGAYLGMKKNGDVVSVPTTAIDGVRFVKFIPMLTHTPAKGGQNVWIKSDYQAETIQQGEGHEDAGVGADTVQG